MIHENNSHRKRGGVVGAAWMVLAVIIPVIVVGVAISWVSHGGSTP
jgi:hypothetical protein